MLLPLAMMCSCRTPSAAEDALGGLDGALIVIDCSSGETRTIGPSLADTRLPPCSTFKILNALIGLEERIITSPAQAFYKWDGVERSIPTWNKDLNLREAFQSSCVPAFQSLARKIGPKRMQEWIDKLHYGNQDISAGIDVFWLPADSRRTILISPREQAKMVQSIVSADVPFSSESLSVLKKLMFVMETDRGRLYGKTGSGMNDHGIFVLGWFVGYTESKGKPYAFACIVKGRNVMSKDARALVERYLKTEDLL